MGEKKKKERKGATYPEALFGFLKSFHPPSYHNDWWVKMISQGVWLRAKVLK